MHANFLTTESVEDRAESHTCTHFIDLAPRPWAGDLASSYMESHIIVNIGKYTGKML